MRIHRRVAPLLFGGALLACSSSPPPPPTEVPKTEASLTEAQPASDSPLEPAQAPQDLFVLGRIKSPEGSIQTLEDWIHLPIPWRERLQKELPAVGSQLVASVPIDVAVTLDPDAMGAPTPLFAVSFGLVDVNQTVDALRAANRQVETLGGGVYFVKLGSDASCIVSRANGAAKARLVCGERRKALDVLGPYMTRSLPTEELAEEDLYLVFRADPLRRRFGKKAHMLKVGVPIFLREASLGNARFDTALSDAAHATADELMLLIEEISEVAIRAELTPDPAVATAKLEVLLNGRRSWTAGSMSERAKEAKPAPALFWRLPANATQAMYATGLGNPERMQPVLDTATELALGALEHRGAKTPSLEKWLDAVKGLGGESTGLVYATGPNLALSDEPSKNGSSLAKALGYHMIGVEGDGGRFSAMLEQTIEVVNDAKLRKLASQELDEKLRHLPQIKRAAARGFPPKTTVYEVKITPKDVEKLTGEKDVDLSEAVTIRVAIVPDGERTWVGLSLDDKLLKATLQQVMTGEEAGSLASRKGLDGLRTTPANSAGFTTLAGYARTLEALNETEADVKVSARDVLLAMPDRGRTPMIFRAVATAEGPGTVMSVTVPQAALTDLTAAAASLFAQAGGL